MTENSRLRMSVVGIVVISLFCALFARLWYLQATAGEQLVAAAEANQVRYVEEPALRGDILDRKGNVLATNRTADAVTMERGLDDDTTDLVVERLSMVLDISAEEIRERLDDPRISPYTPVVIERDVPIEVTTYIQEHRDLFPGVEAERLPVRVYPNGQIMSHVLGYTGEINDEELAAREERGYQLGDTIGKNGVEESYELDLRGEPRRLRIEVNSVGEPVVTEVEREASPGHDVVLTLDLDIQRVAEEALANGMDSVRGRLDRTNTQTGFRAPAGTVVVLDAHDGSVVAMASNPTFDPAPFVDGIPTQLWEQLNDPENHYPLINRAVQGAYAPGSTFKLLTSVAGLESGSISPNSTFMDNGSIEIGDREFFNAGGAANGPIALAQALTVSSNVFFYNIAWDLYRRAFDAETGTYTPRDGSEAIQETARRYGMGSVSGIALPSEAAGRIPDWEWKSQVHAENPEAFPDGLWFPGDAVNTGVGQGDVLVSPLQLGIAYATFANGGTLYKPRVASQILEARTEGEEQVVVREEAPVVRGDVALSPEYRAEILAGLIGVTSAERGTATDAFAGFAGGDVTVAGKTGTGEVAGKQDTSLFVGMLPAENPDYIVLAVVEEAGFGGSVAAPIVRSIMDYLVGVTPSEVAVVEGRPD